MKIAIIVSDSAIPAVISGKSESELLSAISALQISPAALTIKTAKDWLNTLPAPSGWYENEREALKASEVAKIRSSLEPREILPSEIKDARIKLGLSRVAFGKAIGFNGNHNTVNKEIYRIETDPTKKLSKAKQDILFALLAEHEIEVFLLESPPVGNK